MGALGGGGCWEVVCVAQRAGIGEPESQIDLKFGCELIYIIRCEKNDFFEFLSVCVCVFIILSDQYHSPGQDCCLEDCKATALTTQPPRLDI